MAADPVLIDDWHVVARSADLVDGGVRAARLLGEDLVLWRTNGAVRAWQDLCVHRGTRLSLGTVSDGCLVCPYHGWTYGADGECVGIPAHPEQRPPAKARARTYRAIEAYGHIWASLGLPAGLPPCFPEAGDAAFRVIACGPYPVRASGPRIIENFLDVAHFAFVHAGSLGDPGHAEIAGYEAAVGEEGVTAEAIRVWQPNPDGLGVGREVAYRYRVPRPLTARLTKDTDGAQLAIMLSVAPIDPAESIAWMWVAMNYGFETPEAEVRAFQDAIFLQDLPIVESQRPELLPLDLQAELHLRSDRTAIAYREWLGALGLSFGTA